MSEYLYTIKDLRQEVQSKKHNMKEIEKHIITQFLDKIEQSEEVNK